MAKREPTILTPISGILSYESIRLYVAQITPGDAARVLDERNRQNRGINSAQLARLRRAMKKGSWRLTHQGIAFDASGILIDGQHRLTAIVDANQAQRSIVGEGFEALTRVDIDQMWTRQLKDSLRIMGVVARPDIAAMVVNSINRCHGEGAKLDYDSALGMIATYRLGIEWASLAVTAGRRHSFASGAVVSAFAYAFAREPAAVEKAWMDLNSGAIGDPDDAILRLRNVILGGDSRGRSLLRSDQTRTEIFAKTLNALYYRATGQSIKILKSSDSGWRYFAEAYRSDGRKAG